MSPHGSVPGVIAYVPPVHAAGDALGALLRCRRHASGAGAQF